MDEENSKKTPENPPETNNELAECQKKADEYLNNWKRAAADLINYKKEEMERMGLLAKYAKEDTIYKVLPIIDSIYLASAAFGKDGFVSIQKQIEEFLKKEGIEAVETTGQKFNPETMEAVEEVEKGDSGIVIEELQKGYKILRKVDLLDDKEYQADIHSLEKVMRPAKVKISK